MSGWDRISAIVLTSMIFFTVSSCGSFSSPNGVMELAYKAVVDDDLKSFVHALRDNALEKYGNEEGICTVQRRFLGMDSKLDAAKLIHIEPDECGRAKQRTYSVEVLGQKTGDPGDSYHPIVHALVLCDVDYQPVHSECHDPVREAVFCLISELDLKS